MESNTITITAMLNLLIQRRELKFVYFYVGGGEVGSSSSQYSLFIIIDKVTLTDSVNSRRGRKKRGRLSDNNYKANILLSLSLSTDHCHKREAVDCTANIALLLNYFQGIELCDN